MYGPLQDAEVLPGNYEAGSYAYGDIRLPRVDAIAARDRSGKLWIGLTNIDPNQPAEIEISLNGANAKSATGKTLTAPKVDSINTFDAPKTVVPKRISAKIQGGKLALKLEPKSVTVISIEQ